MTLNACMRFIIYFFFNDTATTEIYTLSLHDALPILGRPPRTRSPPSAGPLARRHGVPRARASHRPRSEEHMSELQSPVHLVCRLLLEKKKRRQHSNRRGNIQQPDICCT